MKQEMASKNYKVAITYNCENYFVGEFDKVDEISDFIKNMIGNSKANIERVVVRKRIESPWKVRTQMPGENIIETEFENDGQFSEVIETIMTKQYGSGLELISISH